MASFEWQGIIRVTIGSLSRVEKLDLWREYASDDWLYRKTDEDSPRDPLENTIFLMKTDAMIAAASTRKIEVCKDGEWMEVQDSETIKYDGDSFALVYPPTADAINNYPAQLADLWIEQAIEKNGGIAANLTFFTSVNIKNGKTNSEDKSE